VKLKTPIQNLHFEIFCFNAMLYIRTCNCKINGFKITYYVLRLPNALWYPNKYEKIQRHTGLLLPNFTEPLKAVKDGYIENH
jgi:hypothetical protein